MIIFNLPYLGNLASVTKYESKRCVMLFNLPDGRIIDLNCISRVMPMKDYGRDSKSIDKSRVGFSILLKKCEVLDVIGYYHYNDWLTERNRLKKIREEIITQWSQIRTAAN